MSNNGKEDVLFICYIEKTETSSSILNIGRVVINKTSGKTEKVTDILKLFRDDDADKLYSILTDTSNKDELGFSILNKLEASNYKREASK